MAYGIHKNIKRAINQANSNFLETDVQKRVKDYFINYTMNNPETKGLLLYHKLGSGKTCTSISIANQLLVERKINKVYIFSTATLRENWIKEYCNFCGNSSEDLYEFFIFISYNYAPASVRFNTTEFDLTNCLVIIDEVHNFINSVKNMSKTCLTIYNKILNNDCKILALSGTPVYSKYWEFCLLGKLLKPNAYPDIIKEKRIDGDEFKNFFIQEDTDINLKNKEKGRELFSDIISYYGDEKIDDDFPKIRYQKPINVFMSMNQSKYYIVRDIAERNCFKPKELLKETDPDIYQELNRIYIMAKKHILTRSAANFFYPTDICDIVDFQLEKAGVNPKLQKLVPVKIVNIKGIVKDVNDIIIKNNKDVDSESDDDTITEPKKISVIEFETPSPKSSPILREPMTEYKQLVELYTQNLEKKKKKKFKIYNGKICLTDNLETKEGWISMKRICDGKLLEFSTKLSQLLVNICSAIHQKHVIFTFFKDKAGAHLIKSIFQLFNINVETFTGDLGDTTRTNLLQKFNGSKNLNGELIRVLIITESGMEGITLNGVQNIHFFETPIRFNLYRQAIGRVVRYKSHSDLPINERYVNVWQYWSRLYNGYIKVENYRQATNKNGAIELIQETAIFEGNKETIDEILFRKIMNDEKLIENFLSIIKEYSIT